MNNMVKRNIIKIDEEKCNGCGLCIPNCKEGALRVIDNKARLISDLFCDGLGACLGHCPEGAITIEEREAEPYDEKKTMEENIIPAGKNTIKAHLEHLRDHNEKEYLNQALETLKENNITNPLADSEENKMEKDSPCGCPGTAMREVNSSTDASENAEQTSALRQWPVQLNLLPSQAPFFENSHLLVAADCVPFANPNFHSKLLNEKSLVIGCPKLDDIEAYKEKLTEIFKNNKIKSVTTAIMEVPCCHGFQSAVEEAVKASGKDIPIIKEVISISGEIQ
jgi:ferredoxin